MMAAAGETSSREATMAKRRKHTAKTDFEIWDVEATLRKRELGVKRKLCVKESVYKE